MSILVQEKDIETGDLKCFLQEYTKMICVFHCFSWTGMWEDKILQKPIIVVFVAKQFANRSKDLREWIAHLSNSCKLVTCKIWHKVYLMIRRCTWILMAYLKDPKSLNDICQWVLYFRASQTIFCVVCLHIHCFSFNQSGGSGSTAVRPKTTECVGSG